MYQGKERNILKIVSDTDKRELPLKKGKKYYGHVGNLALLGVTQCWQRLSLRRLKELETTGYVCEIEVTAI